MTFIVPLAAGVIERRGGMLIHGAIIAREYGIACVTGVPDAATLIHTGDEVTVDGYLGIVTVGQKDSAVALAWSRIVRTIHQIAPQRIRLIKQGNDTGGPVVYWMTREQRVSDNWALLLAQNIAVEHKRALVVIFCLVPDYPGANIRHYGFMLKGLQEVEQKLQKLKIPFVLLQGTPPEILPGYLARIKGAFLVTDFDPLHIKRSWQQDVGAAIKGLFLRGRWAQHCALLARIAQTGIWCLYVTAQDKETAAGLSL